MHMQFLTLHLFLLKEEEKNYSNYLFQGRDNFAQQL